MKQFTAMLFLIFSLCLSSAFADDGVQSINSQAKVQTAAVIADGTNRLTAAEPLGRSGITVNIAWLLLAGFLVMFMQAGFAMIDTGLTQAKNAGYTMAMIFMIYGLGMLGYWLCGFALQTGGGGVAMSGNSEFLVKLFGKDIGLFGTRGFFFSGVTYDSMVFASLLFQMLQMSIAAVIPIGSMAERWNFKSFVIYGIFASAILYPSYANWVWGGGWLSQMGKNFGLGHGYVDFAGSSVVHMVGGVAALAGAIMIGPRLGKFRDGKPMAIPGHHIPMVVVGTLVLAFGWFGFNTGASILNADARIGIIAVNTMLAAGAGAFSSTMYMWARYGKPDLTMMCNGMLAGLVAITAPCAFITMSSAMLIGAVAGVLVCISVFFVERTLKVDDPVGAFSVHGVNGAWGVLSLGLFANGAYGNGLNGVSGAVRGLFYGDASQFLAQCIGMLTNFVYVFAVSYVFFRILDKIIGMRVSEEIEFEGLDQAEVAVTAYPDFRLTKAHK